MHHNLIEGRHRDTWVCRDSSLFGLMDSDPMKVHGDSSYEQPYFKASISQNNPIGICAKVWA